MFSEFLNNISEALNRSTEDPYLADGPFNAEDLRIVEIDEAVASRDPLIVYLLNNPQVADVARLDLPSKTLWDLKQRGVRLIVPFISHGQLVGLLCLGSRKNGKGYSVDERELLNQLAARLAPALQVARLVRQQQSTVLERERLEQELSLARHVQQTLLPRRIPTPEGWQIAAYYKPARAVGGDFYDVIELNNGKFAVVMGDVTDKGVPAAMLMAATRSLIRSVAAQNHGPAEVITRVNNLLTPDIPENMFVTCLYAVVNPEDGTVQFANAGHNLPLMKDDLTTSKLWASGMPLGLFPKMMYEQTETVLLPGQSLIIYSDGITEAHAENGQMYGGRRLEESLQSMPTGEAAEDLVNSLVHSFDRFTGEGWQQEDDITLVVLHRDSNLPVQSEHSKFERMLRNG